MELLLLAVAMVEAAGQDTAPSLPHPLARRLLQRREMANSSAEFKHIYCASNQLAVTDQSSICESTTLPLLAAYLGGNVTAGDLYCNVGIDPLPMNMLLSDLTLIEPMFTRVNRICLHLPAELAPPPPPPPPPIVLSHRAGPTCPTPLNLPHRHPFRARV